MSLVIAIKDDDKILIGSDNQTTESEKNKLTCKKNHACKIHLIKDKGIIVASTGLACSSNVVAYRSDLYEDFPQDGLIKEFLVESFVPKLKQILEDGKVVDNPKFKKECYDIIAYKDKMYYISSEYDVMRIDSFFSCGVGAEIATTIYKNSPLSPRDKILEALRYVRENFSCVGAHLSLIDTKNCKFEFMEE